MCSCLAFSDPFASLARMNDALRLAIGSQVIGGIAFSVACASNGTNLLHDALACSFLRHAMQGPSLKTTVVIVSLAVSLTALSCLLAPSLRLAVMLCTVGLKYAKHTSLCNFTA